MTEFRVNNFITLKLEDGITNIYINKKLFRQCKHILMNSKIENISNLNKIDSIDKFAELSANSTKEGSVLINIPAHVKFWAHCSNLQAWDEFDYDTALLHSNLSFPLLRKLSEIGDSRARYILKYEILKRFKEANKSVLKFLSEANYFDFLNEDDIRTILPIGEVLALEEIEKDLQIKFFLALDIELIIGMIGVEPRNLYYIEGSHITGLRIYKPHINFDVNSLSKFRRLRYFVFSHNHLNLLPILIDKLEKLEVLDLSYNNLFKIPNSIERLKCLRELDLSFNKFGKIPNIIKNLSTLKELYLEGNPLTIIPNTFGNLKKSGRNISFFSISKNNKNLNFGSF